MSLEKILIVDDQQPNRRLLFDFISALGYSPFVVGDGAEAIKSMDVESFDLVLLDIMMPNMDGYEVLDKIRTTPRWTYIPVIMISGVDEMESVTRCIKQGADDYLVKPFNPTLLRARVESCLQKKRLHDKEELYRHQIELYSITLEERVREKAKELSEAQTSTIFAMSKLAESRDPETGEHLDRMREYCKILAEQLQIMPEFADKMDADFIENLYAASPLHDIGKVGIPDRILLKPGALTKEEYDIMKEHTVLGGNTLRAVYEKHLNNTFLKTGIEIAFGHHEKWDGSGYPNGISGEDIPLSPRVVALADVYDALTSKRCYKSAFSHEKSRDIIIEGRGKHFDPGIVDAFLAIDSEFIRIRSQFEDSEKHLLE